MTVKPSGVWCHEILTIFIYAVSGPLIPVGFPQFQFMLSLHITCHPFPPQPQRSNPSSCQRWYPRACLQMERKTWLLVPAGTRHRDRLTYRQWVLNRAVLGFLVYPKDCSSSLSWNVFMYLANCMLSHPKTLSLKLLLRRYLDWYSLCDI
jgi:hypothetical protein